MHQYVVFKCFYHIVLRNFLFTSENCHGQDNEAAPLMDGHASNNSEDEPANDESSDGDEDDEGGHDECAEDSGDEGRDDGHDSDCDKTTLVLGQHADVADLSDVDDAASEDDASEGGGGDPPCVLSGRAMLCSGPNCKVCLGTLVTPPSKRSLEDALDAT